MGVSASKTVFVGVVTAGAVPATAVWASHTSRVELARQTHEGVRVAQQPRSGPQRRGGPPRSPGDRSARRGGVQADRRDGAGRSTAGASAKRPSPDNDVDLSLLDPVVRQDLRALPKELADWVAGQLVLAGQLLDSNPAQALEYAQAARAKASRLAVVREAVGVAAYYAGQWQVALSELRAARRMSGSDAFLPMIADSERALGRVDKAWGTYLEAVSGELDSGIRAELTLIAAGIKRDTGDIMAALALLEPHVEVGDDESAVWLARLRYAYADLLADAGRADESRHWFVKAANGDPGGYTDAAERVLELDGFAVEFEEESESDTESSPEPPVEKAD